MTYPLAIQFNLAGPEIPTVHGNNIDENNQQYVYGSLFSKLAYRLPIGGVNPEKYELGSSQMNIYG